MNLVDHFDAEMEVSALSYAARLLFTDLEREGMIERALESLADLGHSQRVGLFILDRASRDLISQGCMKDGRAMVQCKPMPLEGTPLEQVVRSKRPGNYGLAEFESLPWPVEKGGKPGRQCFCAPLVGVDFEVVGLVTLDHPDDVAFVAAEAQPFITYLALLALGLETMHLFRLAVTDGLTGLYVRRYFDIRLGEELGRINRFGGQVSILLMDLDHFKTINDAHGHIFGDKVLRQTAATLSKAARRKIDIVCRYGGDELILILPGIDAAGAKEVGERIRKDVESQTPEGPTGPVMVTISGGVASVTGPTDISVKDFVDQADKALYFAKQSSRNRVAVFQG